jgi:hemerythrin
MTTLTWSDTLVLNQPQMDATHVEFVALLADAEAALALTEAELLARFDALVAHTVEHFAQEDRWMAATGFAPDNCHAFQHQAVLGVMTECAKRAREVGNFEPLRMAVQELATWFPQHAQMMDAALAEHMAAIGFDPLTGHSELVIADAAPITGCASTSCGG